MKKQPLSLLLCTSLCLSFAPSVSAAQETASVFTDVPAGSWFEEGVMTCAEKGVMVGTREDCFSPDRKLTAVECLTLAVRLYDLQHGGDGVMKKAPEDWGRITLTLADGTVFDGYSEDGPFSWWEYRSARKGLYVTAPGETAEEQAAWGEAHSGAAALTIDNVTYQGTVDCWMPTDSYDLMFSPELPSESIASVQAVICAAIYADIPSPDHWYRDVVYTAHQLGLKDGAVTPGFTSLLSRTLYNGSGCSRMEFSLALAEAAGELEKRFTVESLPDLAREGNEDIYTLYEAGVLTGMDEFGRFGADSSLTRAQAAVIVARVLDETQRVTTPPMQGGAYAKAVAELRNSFGYHNEQTIETPDCTIFIYDKGGMMKAPTGAMQLIYKLGSQLGEGTVIGLPHAWVNPGLAICYPADTMTLHEDEKTFTYTYYRPEDIVHDGQVMEKAGTITFTVDLPTGEVTEDLTPPTYEGALAHVTRKRIKTPSESSENREVVRLLETGDCSIVLTKGRFVETYDDYILSLVYKPGSAMGNGTIRQLILPSTVYDKGYPWYNPTDRAPDTLEVSEDGSTLTYTYSFDEALEDFHEAGTYSYTVDIATGELSVAHTAN